MRACVAVDCLISPVFVGCSFWSLMVTVSTLCCCHKTHGNIFWIKTFICIESTGDVLEFHYLKTETLYIGNNTFVWLFCNTFTMHEYKLNSQLLIWATHQNASALPAVIIFCL